MGAAEQEVSSLPSGSPQAESDDLSEVVPVSEAVPVPTVVNVDLDPETLTSSTESLCTRCMGMGLTRIMVTDIPRFRQVILMSFECPHCGWKNNEIQSGMERQTHGCQLTLTVTDMADLDRQVIKSEHASLKVIEVDFEIPSTTQSGVCSTLEGMIMGAVNALTEDQPQRRLIDRPQADQIQRVIDRLRDMASGTPSELPFTVVLDDPSGNSHIESIGSLPADNRLHAYRYPPTDEQLRGMGHYSVALSPGTDSQPTRTPQTDTHTPQTDTHTPQTDTHTPQTDTPQLTGAHTPEPPHALTTTPEGASLPPHLQSHRVWDLSVSIEDNITRSVLGGGESKGDIVGGGGEVSEVNDPIVFTDVCSHCGGTSQTRMCEIDIPGFRRCMIMASACDHCGSRDNEVKPSGAINEEGGRLWTLNVESVSDLNRDVLKADSAGISIEVIDFEMAPGTQGGIFTTVEGLLTNVADHLADSLPFALGDSAPAEMRNAMKATVEGMRRLATDPSALPFTLVLRDPADHSFIGPRREVGNVSKVDGEVGVEAPIGHADAQLITTLFKRTDEDDDELGLKDMKV
eukprot:GHVN01043732.1.p1 GENE.GHVN01043732.1~~GHVN01043732.1.p1  ORF type:complete len:573 (-),score=159.73 GHVN01043732.1:241-1959(-)